MTKETEITKENKDWILTCQLIVQSAGWVLIGCEEWDTQILCHAATGRVMNLIATDITVTAMWDSAVNLIQERSHRA